MEIADEKLVPQVTEYWGQRIGFDLTSDLDGVQIIQAKERAVDHSVSYFLFN